MNRIKAKTINKRLITTRLTRTIFYDFDQTKALKAYLIGNFLQFIQESVNNVMY